MLLDDALVARRCRTARPSCERVDSRMVSAPAPRHDRGGVAGRRRRAARASSARPPRGRRRRARAGRRRVPSSSTSNERSDSTRRGRSPSRTPPSRPSGGRTRARRRALRVSRSASVKTRRAMPRRSRRGLTASTSTPTSTPRATAISARPPECETLNRSGDVGVEPRLAVRARGEAEPLGRAAEVAPEQRPQRRAGHDDRRLRPSAEATLPARSSSSAREHPAERADLALRPVELDRDGRAPRLPRRDGMACIAPPGLKRAWNRGEGARRGPMTPHGIAVEPPGVT